MNFKLIIVCSYNNNTYSLHISIILVGIVDVLAYPLILSTISNSIL